MCVLLTACGFEPLYGSHARGPAAESELAQVKIDYIEDRTGQMLRNELLKKMNPLGEPRNPRYFLAVDLQESKADLGIKTDDTATFAKLIVTAGFSLTDRATGNVVLSSQAKSSNSYSILQSSYATLKAEEDGRKRAASQLADTITTTLAIFLKNHDTANMPGVEGEAAPVRAAPQYEPVLPARPYSPDDLVYW